MRDRFPALRTGAVVVLCFLAWSSSGASPRKPPIDIDLSGRWVFNETASREQNQNVRGGDARGMPGSQRRPVRGVPGGTDLGGGFPGGRPGDGDAPGSARPERPRIPDRVRNLTITQTDTAVVLSALGGPEVVVITDGRRRDVAWLDGNDVKVKAEWTDNGLVMERREGSGLTVRETYLRYPRSTRLSVDTEIKGSNLPRTMKLVRLYDLLAAPEDTSHSVLGDPMW